MLNDVTITTTTTTPITTNIKSTSTAAPAASFTRLLGFFRFGGAAGSATRLQTTMQTAYKAFAAENEIWVESLFDKHFMTRYGAPIIASYLDGLLTRHQAAVALAHAWETHLVPANITLRKEHRADAVMAADRYLDYLPR